MTAKGDHFRSGASGAGAGEGAGVLRKGSALIVFVSVMPTP
jgi:hypothetical protein